jgi:DNA mismatch repair protein MutS
MVPKATSSPDETPLMKQWHDAKARHPEALVFFRVGDFYELFHDDAREASRILGLTLTSRNNGAAAHVPMAGVPARALDGYLSRLIEAGRRAAICEQVEDPSEARGIVRREVVETVTPGTILQDHLLQDRRNNFLVAWRGGGLAALDLSTGDFQLHPLPLSDPREELGRLEPAELLVARDEVGHLPPPRADGGFWDGIPLTLRDPLDFDRAHAADEICRHFGVADPTALGFGRADGELLGAAGALLRYVADTQPLAASHLQRPRVIRPGGAMALDEMTRRNLELVEPLRSGEAGGTLVDVLDETVTPMGGRRLRQWILRPLLDRQEILARHDAVDELAHDRARRHAIRDALASIRDLERLAAKVSTGRIAPRELLALRTSLEPLPALVRLGEGIRAPLLRGTTLELDPLTDLTERIELALADDAPQALQDGGVIRPGFSPRLDELRELRSGAVDFIAQLQVRERERTGIASLKVGFNKVFGYYLEVTRANLDRVPDDYIRKQTLSTGERYVTPELKTWEEKVTEAEEGIQALETELFQALRREIAEDVPRIQRAADAVATLDVLAAFAQGAVRRGYVRPHMHPPDDDGRPARPPLRIEAGRHPVVETMMPREAFIPNDLVLGDEGWIIILTGPNMAGKSTILRQVGLIQLMAQIGSFVPAAAAELPVCDRIFTRVGASDNLARGQSTFMVEMNETAAILHEATDRSLVLLDEIGRGTSTYDGVSIAWAVTEHLHDAVGARTIFATHYHELTQLGDLLGGVRNMNVSVRETDEGILFLRRLEAGGADRSYGIQVARLAGLPPAVLARARLLLTSLEQAHQGPPGIQWAPPGAPSPEPQLSLFQPQEDPLIRQLAHLDLTSMTPLEALNLLSTVQADLRQREERSS